ncbi:MAG: adenine methyltransferase [Bacteroidota bacterium]|nr:MAG: adenine methyltransferase [Bacteroidota bacterium]
MEQPEKLKLTTLDIRQQQLEKLRELFPEVFTEGNKVDWDRLRLTLGEQIDVGKERFGMNWPGKADCFKTIQQPSIATLIPMREESIDFDTTKNLFIEGDNLEVLKLLQKSYLGKVKMIYIDPPYNTGNDFIYPDNYSENLQTYLEYTGQVDSEGRKFSTNAETDGRFHSKWMNMMYPRLFLAKNLLKEDGIIFISIDDRECDNLKRILDEIFGEENFVERIIWKKRYGGGAKEKYLVNLHEYILMYAKDKDSLDPISVSINPDFIEKYYTKRDDNFEKRGPYRLQPLEAAKSMGERKNLVYEIPCPDGSKLLPKRQWLWARERVMAALGKNELEFSKDKDGNWSVSIKQYLKDEDGGEKEIKVTSIVEEIYTQHGSKEIESLFGDVSYFSYPKPTSLIKHLAKFVVSDFDIVVDFFAGSGSTAHAILELNKENEKNIRFITVQLPESTVENSAPYRAGFKTIADISKERIRRVISNLKKEIQKTTATEKATLFGEQPKKEVDLGFKVFKLNASNFNLWKSDVDKTPEAIAKQLELNITHISAEATQEAILYELLLKSGFELTTPVIKESIAGKTVYSIAEGELLICLERELSQDLIKGIAEKKPSRVICLDEGFQNNDQLKTNAVQIMKSKGVTKFQTV